jgi:hypothetical protein
VPGNAVSSVGFLWGAIAADPELWGFCGDDRELLRAADTPATLARIAPYPPGLPARRGSHLAGDMTFTQALLSAQLMQCVHAPSGSQADACC